MNLIDTINQETWKFVYKLSEDNNKKEHDTYVIASEFTGTKLDIENRKDSERNDVVLLVPMIVINITNKTNIDPLIRRIVQSDFQSYITGHLPLTYNSSKYVKAKLNETDLVIKFGCEEELKEITINLSERERCFLANNDSFSLAFIDGGKNYIGRVQFSHSTCDSPIFPIVKISITTKGSDKILLSIIENIGKVEKVLPGNLDNFLDIIGSSDYYIYQSTNSSESLPSIKNLALGKICYACGKEEVTREHCSPKWMTDKYKVKPLIGNILCSECNGWFGKNIERGAEEYLQIKTGFLPDIQRLFISIWCIKTAITMSLASGVIVDAEWLPKLRNKKLPEGIEVYFDTGTKLNESGFNYGVSRFNKNLARVNFLFSFTCQDFSFEVIKTTHKESLELPFCKFFPVFEMRKESESITNFADFHQKIHEFISKEKTIDFELPIRNQSKRD
ncbi:hypothetical protein M2145_002650 [Lachnospiraceae bacterium PF1-21]